MYIQFFFFNDTATTEIYTLSLHDALPISEIRPGADLAALAAEAAGAEVRDGDVVIVTHKVVSKAEGRLVDLRTVEPSALAKAFASRYGKDSRQIEVVLRESRRIVRMDRGLIISETPHGFVCANAGVDASNVPGDDVVCLLPVDPDASAARLRERLAERTGDRKSTRLNSSHANISYAVFCLKKKKT